MRIPLIAGNWKMNTTFSEAVKLVNEIKPQLEALTGVEIAVCPPFVSLTAVSQAIADSGIKLGAQNVYYQERGAFTGEVSPLMLAGLCDYVILGHSERRQYFSETNEVVSRKVKAALKVSLAPILCIGENLAEFESGRTEQIVTTQLNESLRGVGMPRGLVIAYEPVWAIGTGKAATGPQANRVIALIRETTSRLYGAPFGRDVRILYGGSVTGDNITEFVGQPEIDGALVGGASLKADQFVSIVRQTAQVKKE